MPRKGDSVWVCSKRTGGRAVVAPPSPRAYAGILGMRMLRIEERLGGVNLTGMRTQIVGQAVKLVLFGPVCANEGIALDMLYPKVGIGFLENLLPDPRRTRIIIGDCILARKIGILPYYVYGGPDVVVAVDEEFFDMSSVLTAVARKSAMSPARSTASTPWSRKY